LLSRRGRRAIEPIRRTCDLRRYETIYITHPEVTEEELSELQGKINSILTSFKGELIKLDDWGVRKLTYEVRKNSRGRFFLLDYAAGTELIRELERNLRLHDRVLRFQTVKIGDQVTPDSLKALREAATPEKVKTPERIEPPAAVKGPGETPKEGGEKE